ncbi:ammonia permease [Saxibacter everestensis]|uniref:Ammonia permease n=1 Tax=Saxibacter everestensis TaxID=2909229 RepID=A0ABY8QWC1_9MICO|nr:ammonia permease [Brevibacteriaceae bacterium ZFBP1038]
MPTQMRQDGVVNSWLRVIIAALLGVALASTTFAGPWFFVGAVIVLVLCFAYGWPRLVDSPQPMATTVLLSITGVAGVLTVGLSPDSPYLDWLPLVGGLGILASFIQHLSRGVGASDAVLHVASQVAGVAIVLTSAAWLAVLRVPGHGEALIVGLTALVLALATTVIPWPARYTSPLAIVLAAAGAAAAAGVIADTEVAIVLAAGLGAALGVLVAAVHRLLGMAVFVNFASNKKKRLSVPPLNRAVAPAGPEEIPVPAAEKKVLAELTAESSATLSSRAASAGVQLALGTTPIALSGVVVYAVERLFIG